jgi:hypothetical protein
VVNSRLSRSLVSYQSNRNRPGYRWFKYKEGFSAGLIEFLLGHFQIETGRLLDPFAGSGAALFVANEHGLESEGVELMPVGIQVITARRLANRIKPRDLRREVQRVAAGDWRIDADPALAFQHLRITAGAFPKETERDLAQFRTYVRDRVKNAAVRGLLDLAAMSVLESVSYTRKDGQYLRWDSRAPRELSGKAFHKGPVLSFEAAIVGRLQDMLADLESPGLFAEPSSHAEANLTVHEGSCMDVLPELQPASFDLLVTSPPYCNRYDYTRTYALELAYLGVDENRLKSLRQSLLSCTVENKSKSEAIHADYTARGQVSRWRAAESAFTRQAALQEVLELLDHKARRGELNNPHVARMVRNYFYESTFAIFEWARLLKRGGRVAVINDNVQYGGEEVPVDLVLCDLAREAGFETEHIWTLDRGKGNSSQQMGVHGRKELRKCVYVWSRR